MLRLAGLYSRQRGPFHFLSKSLSENRVLRGKGSKILNLIHDDDAAGLAIEMIERPELRLVLGVDGQGQTRAELYGRYARYWGWREPRFQDRSFALCGPHCRSTGLPLGLKYRSLDSMLVNEPSS